MGKLGISCESPSYDTFDFVDLDLDGDDRAFDPVDDVGERGGAGGRDSRAGESGNGCERQPLDGQAADGGDRRRPEQRRAE